MSTETPNPEPRKLTPHEQRLAARMATYPNSATEQAAIKEIDESVRHDVQKYERMIVGEAERWVEEQEIHIEAADTFRAIITEDILPLAESVYSDDISKAISRFEEVKASVTTVKQNLEAAAREAEWRADKCSDPYSDFNLIMARYPALNR